MGYSHYFEICRSLTAKEFESLTTDTQVIVGVAKELGIRLCSDPLGGRRRQGAEPTSRGDRQAAFRPNGKRCYADSRGTQPFGSGAAKRKEAVVENWVDRITNTLQTGRKGNYFAHLEVLPERPALYGDLDRPLPEELQRVLEAQGIGRLYSHQAEAINHLAGGDNVIVSTSTASGKSLCYHLPALASILARRDSSALYVFPTKALAHDQLDSLGSLVPPGAPIVCNAYDGDTPKDSRRNIRRTSSIVITNPDMLHTAILPYHRGWIQFLRNLRFVVIDVAHYYRGVLSAHVAMIVRRLRRVCREYGADPQFVLCSATLTNSAEHAENLVGLPFRAVDQDGSPSGGRSFVFWNPAGIQPDSEGRISLNMEAAEPTAGLVGRDVKTMTFARSRAGWSASVTSPGTCCTMPRTSSNPTAPATWRTTGGRRSASSRTGGSSGWLPPMRWSSGSTSAAWTPR